MPHVEGYSIYVHLNDGESHTVRLYRDIDDTHLHSWEGCVGLHITMEDVTRMVKEDAAARRREPSS